MLAGDTFGNTPIRLPVLVFKLIYLLTSLMDLRATLAFKRKRRRNNRQAMAP